MSEGIFVCQKISATPLFSNPFLSVWITEETLRPVSDLLHLILVVLHFRIE